MMAVWAAVQLAALWVINGAACLVYVAVDQAVVLLAAPPLAWLALTAPVPQRPAVWGTGALALLAASLAAPPIPVVLLTMAWAGALGVWLDHYTPNNLRWRATGGLALEALAALGFTAASAYFNLLEAAPLQTGETAALLAQGHSLFNTLALLATWLGVPLGYFALLAQGVLIHPPLAETPAAMIQRVRTRQGAAPSDVHPPR